MAKFTPQDLMNPMQKIASALEDVKKDTSAILEIVSGSTQNTYNSLISIEQNVEIITETLLNISKKMKLSSTFKKNNAEGGIGRNTKEGIELFKNFGIGVKEFSIGMFVFSKVPDETTTNFVSSITTIIDALSKADKQAFVNAERLGAVGKSIFQFTGYILLAALLAVPAAVAMPIIALEIWLFGVLLGGKEMQKNLSSAVKTTVQLAEVGWSIFAFEGIVALAGLLAVPAALLLPAIWLTVWGMTKILGTLTKNAGDVVLGSIVLTAMGISLAAFSISLLLFGAATRTLDFKSIMMGAVVIGIIGLTCYTIGQPAVFPYILLGAVALTAMSLPLLIMSTSLILFALAMKLIDDKMPAKMTKLIIGLGLAFAAVGVMHPLVLMGGLAMIAASTSIIVLGVGLLLFGAALKLIDERSQSRITSLVMILGVTMAGVGALAPLITLGAIATTLMGVSLMSIGIGLTLLALPLKMITQEDQDRLPKLFTSIGVSFSELGMLSPLIMLGSLAMTVASAAMMSLVPGLALMKLINIDEEKLKNTISAVRNGFLGINENDNAIKVVAKSAASVAAASAIMLVAPAYVIAGAALSSLTKGLVRVKDLNWKEEDNEKLMKMLAAVSGAFAQVSSAGSVTTKVSFGGLFGKLFGGWSVDRNKVKEGIDSVKDAGKAVIDISEGLVGFTKWYEANRNLLDMNDGKSPFFEALKTTITSVSTAFAMVGGDTNNFGDNKGIFSVFKPKESLVQKGIESVKGVGETLKDLASGLITFTDWYDTIGKKKIDISNQNSPFFIALRDTLTSVGGAFAAIAGDPDFMREKRFGPFKWNKNKVLEGIETVDGVGESLNGILDSIIKFTDFYNTNKKDLETTTFENINGHLIPRGGLLGALNLTISSVGKAFASLGGEENEYKSFLFFSGNAVADGIAAVNNVDKALESITNGVQVFLKANISEQQINNVVKLITSLNVFGKLEDVDIDDIGDDFNSFSKNFIKGLDRIYNKKESTTRMNSINGLLLTMERQVRFNTFNKAADGITKIAEAVNKIDIEKGKAFSDLFVAASNLKDNTRFYEDLMKAVEDIKKVLEQNGMTASAENNRNNNAVINQQPQNQQIQQIPQRQNASPVQKMPKELKVNNLTIYAENVNTNY